MSLENMDYEWLRWDIRKFTYLNSELKQRAKSQSACVSSLPSGQSCRELHICDRGMQIGMSTHWNWVTSQSEEFCGPDGLSSGDEGWLEPEKEWR